MQFVEFDGWRAIDALETDRGEPLGRPRVKLTEVDEMLEAARERGGDVMADLAELRAR